MTRSRIIVKWILYSLSAFFFLWVQNALFDRISIWGLHPFVLPLLTVIPATLEPRHESLIFACLFGLLCDFTAPGPIGCFYCITFLIGAGLAGVISMRLLMPGVFCSLLVSACSFVISDLLRMLFMGYLSGVSLVAASVLMGKELLLALLPVLPVYGLSLAVHRYIQNS